MQNGLRSVKIFLLGFLGMLVGFGIIGAALTSGGQEFGAGRLYILFGLQQFLTIGVLLRSLKKGGWEGLDAWMNYFGERFKRKGRGLFWKWVIGGFVLYMIVNAGLFTLVENMGREIPGLYGDQSVMVMLQDLNITGTMDRIMTILMIVIVGPVVEELVYRGLITDALMQKRRWGGVVLGAFIFALIHLEFAVFWNLFILALILGVIYYKTGSMRYSFLFHLIINGMGIAALWAQENGVIPEL